MPLDFPATPALNDIYTFGGRSWQWNGTAWESVTSLIELTELLDVNVTAPVADYSIIKYNTSTGVWENAAAQNIATTANPSFAGVTADNIQVGITTTNEIDTVSGNLTIDSAGGTVTIDDNLTVSGDLTVNGTTTTVNTATLNVSDNIVVLNNDVTGSPTENAGLEVERGTSTNVLVRWNETNDKWELTNDGTTYGNIVTTADSGTVTSTMIADGTIVDADINASAAINTTKITNWEDDQVVLSGQIFS